LIEKDLFTEETTKLWKRSCSKLTEVSSVSSAGMS
jgi:hypothetical protein